MMWETCSRGHLKISTKILTPFDCQLIDQISAPQSNLPSVGTSASPAIGPRRSIGQLSAAFQPFSLERSRTSAFLSGECVLGAHTGRWRKMKAAVNRMSCKIESGPVPFPASTTLPQQFRPLAPKIPMNSLGVGQPKC